MASTMKIVDSWDEQDLLVQLLEDSKPLRPAAAEALEYLLAPPFRYDPRHGGSRCRAATDPDVFTVPSQCIRCVPNWVYWRRDRRSTTFPMTAGA